MCEGEARLCSRGPQRHSSPVPTPSATLLSTNEQIPELPAKRVPANGDMQVAPTGYHAGSMADHSQHAHVFALLNKNAPFLLNYR